MPAIHYDAWKPEYKKPFGAVKVNSEVTFTIDAVNLWLKDPKLVVFQDYFLKEYPLLDNHDGSYSAAFIPSKAGVYFYYFKTTVVENNSENFYCCCKQHGGISQLVTNEDQAKTGAYQLTVYEQEVSRPAWYQAGICYQIFPDRFFNGNQDGHLNQRKPNSFIYGTTQDLPMYVKNADGSIARWDFYGGNLQGIIQKIPYLKDLGVTIIYLNPIFEASSNHRYDTNDYFKIDPMLGNQKDFEDLVAKLHQNGMKIILDGVFSHVGKDSRYFNASQLYGDKQGAYNDPHSPYYPWFTFKKYPTEYDAWWGVSDLPTVNKNDPTFQDFIYKNADSVIAYWTRLGVDGWRLDVADELPDEFIEGIRQKLKQFPEKILIGEVWEDASNKIDYHKRRRYTSGFNLDGAMNYPLRNALISLFEQSQTPLETAEALMTLRENYPLNFYFNALNNVGTHDTVRIWTALKGDFLKISQVFACLFMLPGVPTIYYGDEAGLAGREDPDNRRFYPWGHENKALFRTIKQLIQYRKTHKSLQSGDLLLMADDHFLVIGRFLAHEAVVYVLNASGIRSIYLPEQLQKIHDIPNLAPKLAQKLAGKSFDPWQSQLIELVI